MLITLCMCSLTASNEIFSCFLCVCAWHISSLWMFWWDLKLDEHLCVRRNSCYPHVCAISIGYWFSGECIMNMIRPIVVGGYCWLFPCINTLRPRQNGCQFPKYIFKWIFLNENAWNSINISLKFVPRGPINYIPTLVQVMAWRRSGDKPLSEPMMVRLPTHICVTRSQMS